MRSNNPLDSARAAFLRAVGKAETDLQEAATVGWRKSATEVAINVPGRAAYVYVTRTDQTVHIARNEANVPRTAFYPVRVVLRGNTYVIVGRDNSNAAALANLPDNAYGVPGHPHSADDVSETASRIWFSTAEETKLAGIEAGADVTDAGNIAAAITGASTDDTIVDADVWGYLTGGTLVKTAWSNIKAVLKTYFDTLYGLLGSANTWTAVNTFNDRVDADTVRARDANGLRLEDDAGNLGVFVEDGGQVGFNQPTPTDQVHVLVDGNLGVTVEHVNSGTTNPWFSLKKSTTQQFWALAAAAGAFLANAATGDMIFRTAQSTRILFGVDNGLGTANATLLLTGDAIGSGVTTPQGKLHIHDGTSGWLKVTKTGVVGSEVEIIPDGTGDVVRCCLARVSAYGSGGTIQNPSTFLQLNTPGAGSVEVDVFTVGLLKLKLYSTGQLVVYRGSGSETWTITLDIQWQ